jgi:2'-5' RNA ligase
LASSNRAAAENESPTAPCYSIWIVPPEPARTALAAQIDRLSAEYATPRFPPHVTVLGDLALSEPDALARTAELAALLEPFRLEFGDVGRSDERFRSLYVDVRRSEQVVRMHDEAVRILGLVPDREFEPHLSLLYGSLPVEAKRDAARSVEGRLPRGFEADRLELAYSSSAIPIHDWRAVREFALQRP